MATLINDATGLKRRTRTALQGKGGTSSLGYSWPERPLITTVEQLSQCTERELLSYRGLGLHCLRDIRSMLKRRGFTPGTSTLLSCENVKI